MKTDKKHALPWIMLFITAFLGMVFAIVITMRVSATEQGASENHPCADNWWEDPSSAEFTRCNALTKTNTAASLQQQIETAVSRPTLTPLPTITPGSESPGPAPTVTIPPALQQVKEIDRVELVGSPMRGGNSVWQLGAILVANGKGFSRLLLIAHPSQDGVHASLSLRPERFEYDDLLERYGAYWEIPEDVGNITITTVSGVIITDDHVKGIVSFVTDQGQPGTFNLDTEEWTVEGESWLLAPTVAPTP